MSKHLATLFYCDSCLMDVVRNYKNTGYTCLFEETDRSQIIGCDYLFCDGRAFVKLIVIKTNTQDLHDLDE